MGCSREGAGRDRGSSVCVILELLLQSIESIYSRCMIYFYCQVKVSFLHRVSTPNPHSLSAQLIPKGALSAPACRVAPPPAPPPTPLKPLPSPPLRLVCLALLLLAHSARARGTLSPEGRRTTATREKGTSTLESTTCSPGQVASRGVNCGKVTVMDAPGVKEVSRPSTRTPPWSSNTKDWELYVESRPERRSWKAAVYSRTYHGRGGEHSVAVTAAMSRNVCLFYTFF